MSRILFTLLGVIVAVSCIRVKRQDPAVADNENDYEKELCKERNPGEWFRLVATEGGDECRNVIQCTSSGLQAIRCPPGLYFDIEAQTCNWKDQVRNCNTKSQERKAKPLLATDEPLCQEDYLACADSVCIPRKQFCDGIEHCADGSDESQCDINNDPNRAPVCNEEICQIPECFCSSDGTAVPGGLNPQDIPQMVTITFDDAINVANIDLYDEIFNGERVNPNGCHIKATFFVSHKYANYSAVKGIHERGHEIAAHSITHTDNETFWSTASIDDWAREMAGARIIAEKFANITDNSIVGLRAPYLRVGGNNQFTMMEEQAFLYDSTVTAPLSNPPLWPYTLYFRMPHTCYGNLQNCPTRSHAVWEMVMNELDMRDDPTFNEALPGCAMVDSCSTLLNGDQFYNFLNYNFDRHYLTNRAPFGLYFHAAWLKNNPEFFDAFLYWLDEILQLEDVYFVTMTQAIQWIQNPRTIDQAATFEPWKDKCTPEVRHSVCGTPNSCATTTKELPGETLRLHTCVKCPNQYPWILDPLGEGRV